MKNIHRKKLLAILVAFLTVTEMPSHGIAGYFGSPALVPMTLKAVVLGEGVSINEDSFRGLSDITIYVSKAESDLCWDENFPGWSHGNRVVYGDKWKTVTFYSEDGKIFSESIVLNQQIIRQPYGKDYVDGDYRFVFAGYDLDLDGAVDSIPATSSLDISARAVYRKEYRCVRDGHTPGTNADCDSDQLCTVCGEIVTHRLGHDYVGEITPPTCTERGYTTHTCTRCGNAYTDGETEALGHSYTDTVIPPTCAGEGYTVHTCTRCHHTYTDSTVAALPHDYEDAVIPPTCTEQGYTLRTCRVCQQVRKDNPVPAAGHTPGEAATCTEHQYCLVCGDLLISALGHAVQVERIPATCISQGYTRHFCERCDWGYVGEFTPFGDHVAGEEADCVNDQLCLVCGTILTELLGHDYTSRVTRPTCLHEGYTTHTCGRCGDSYRDSVTEPLGHNPGTEASCDRDQTCTVCSALLAERLGHDYAAKVIDPTCDSLGYTDHTCSRCGHNYTDNEIPAFGHTPDGEADCERDQTCTVCGQVLAESTGHDYTEVYTPPTCTEGGYTTYTCGRCGESHRDGLMDPRGHNSGDWIVDTEPAPGVMGSKHMECTVCGVILDTKELESLPVETVAEPVTEAPTEEPAETLTSAPAESMSPAESATKPQSPDGSGGCSGTVGAGVLILLLWSGLATLLLPRRGKEER